MPFTRPTLTELRDRILGDYKSELSLTTILRRSLLSALARANAAAAHVLHGYAAYVAKQLFPDTQDETNLLRFCGLFGVSRNAATFARLNVQFVGTTGGVVEAGKVLQRSDGVQFEVEEEITVPASGTASGVVLALESGSGGNTDDDSELSLVSPIAGVDSAATVTSTATEAEDQETIEAYRIRVQERMQNPPAGGKVSDYKAWAKLVTGVTRVWVHPAWLGEGTVGISFVEDGEDDIIPSDAKVDEVQASIVANKPVTAQVTTFAPIEKVLNLSIAIKPNTSAVRTAVTEELQDMILREAQVSGSWKNADETYDGGIPLSKIREAVSIATGEDDHEVLSPTVDVEATAGELVTLGTITFSTKA